MKKILYIVSLFLLLIPFHVSALEVTHATPKSFYIFNSQGNSKLIQSQKTNAGQNSIYRYFFDSPSNFGNSAPLTFADIELSIPTNFNLSKYEYMLISLYGAPVYDVKLNGMTCYPSSSMVSDNNGEIFVGTYICPVPTSNTFWLDTYFTNTISGSLYLPSGITFVEKDTTSSDISGAINNQTKDVTDSINEQTKKQEETNQQLGDLNNNITSSDVDSSGATGFFGDYEDKDYGLYDIITAPLEFIKTLTNQTCNTMVLDLPFVSGTITLPCMSEIYSKWFGKLFILYQTITTGLIAYWVGVRILFLVKGFKDPENDKIEVMDL